MSLPRRASPRPGPPWWMKEKPAPCPAFPLSPHSLPFLSAWPNPSRHGRPPCPGVLVAVEQRRVGQPLPLALLSLLARGIEAGGRRAAAPFVFFPVPEGVPASSRRRTVPWIPAARARADHAIFTALPYRASPPKELARDALVRRLRPRPPAPVTVRRASPRRRLRPPRPSPSTASSPG